MENKVIDLTTNKVKKIRDLYKELKIKKLERKMSKQVSELFEAYYLTQIKK
jgi:hypothetical protein